SSRWLAATADMDAHSTRDAAEVAGAAIAIVGAVVVVPDPAVPDTCRYAHVLAHPEDRVGFRFGDEEVLVEPDIGDHRHHVRPSAPVADRLVHRDGIRDGPGAPTEEALDAKTERPIHRRAHAEHHAAVREIPIVRVVDRPVSAAADEEHLLC